MKTFLETVHRILKCFNNSISKTFKILSRIITLSRIYIFCTEFKKIWHILDMFQPSQKGLQSKVNYYCRLGEYYEEIQFITSRRGKQLLVHEQYVFARNSVSKAGVAWACSSRCSKNCKAQVWLSNEGALVVINSNHSHEPPVYYVNNNGHYANRKFGGPDMRPMFITSKRGTKVLLFQHYTFCKKNLRKDGSSWACTSHSSKKCFARVCLSNDGIVSVVDPNHCHEPPSFYINQDGEYVRM
ncbi:unnamed protein product, partial [Brenthis ino]